MRRHALHLLEVSKPDADKVEELRPRLLEYLSESDEESVVLPTLGVLSAWNDPPMSVEMLVRMANNPRSAVSESAVRTLGRTWPDAVDELTTFVGSRLPLVRSTAAAMLSASDAGRTRLLDLLCDHEQDRVRREIAERLVRTSTAVSKADVTRLRRKFMDDCVATERYDRPLLEYLAGQDRDGFNKTVVRRARGYVENDRANDAISILQPLVRWRHGSEEARYWLAIAHLHRATERSPEDDDFRRGVGLFSSLSRTEGWSLPARVARGSSLDTTVVLAALESLAAHGPTEAADVATMLEAVEVGASRTLRTAKKAVESVLAGL